jgi:hypothetical protein
VLAIMLAALVSFAPGERLEYDLRYGPVALGSLTLQSLGRDTLGDLECDHFRADLELTRSLSWVFWAHYRLESWCTDPGMVTLRSYKRTREPKYRAEWTALYDPVDGWVHYTDGRVRRIKRETRDLLTTWYYLRSVPILRGDTVSVSMHVDGKNYDLVAVGGANRRVSVPAGQFDCIAVVPNAGTPVGTVYLNRDEDRVPVVIRTRVGGLVVSAHLRKVGPEEER